MHLCVWPYTNPYTVSVINITIYSTEGSAFTFVCLSLYADYRFHVISYSLSIFGPRVSWCCAQPSTDVKR